jgi:O-antigen/teichoic acid export membrane protein
VFLPERQNARTPERRTPNARTPERPVCSLERSFSWSLLGNAIYAGCQWSMLVVLAKLTTPASVGQFSLALAITAPVFVCLGPSLRLGISTDSRREFQFGSYLGLWAISLALAFLAIGGLVLALGYGAEMRWVILIVAAGKTFDSASELVYGLLMQHERMDRIAISRMIQGTLQLAALGIVLFLTGAVVWGAVALAVVSALVTTAYDARSAALVLGSGVQGFRRSGVRGEKGRRGGHGDRPHLSPERLNARTLGKLAWLSFPLGVVLVLDSLNAGLPRYFIERYLGKASLGHFAAVAYMMAAGVTVVNAVVDGARARLARQFIEDLRAFRVLLLKLMAAAVAVGALGILVALCFGERLLTLLYRRDYAAQGELLVWVMAGAALWYLASAMEAAINATRLFHAEVPLHVVAVMVTALGCLLLVPRYGLIGAGWGLCLGMAARLASTVIIVGWALTRPRSTG